MTEVAPTTAQLVARAEKAEKDLESTLKAAETLSSRVQTALDLLAITFAYKDVSSPDAIRLISIFLRDSLDKFDTWDQLPF